MAKVSNEAKQRYLEKIKEYKSAIEEIRKKEKQDLETIAGESNGVEYKKLSLADEVLNLVSYYLLMNSLSLTVLGVKNEAFLNDARKALYKGIIYLEEVVSAYIDAPFSDYEEKLSKIEKLTVDKRYFLLRKLGFAIHSVIDGFGDNSKWKWSFVELEGRFATVSKNFLDLRNLLAGLDPRVEGYESRLSHLVLVKRLMQEAADKYRQKYELSTSRIDDFKTAIDYLAGLRRLHIVMGEADDSEASKKKIEIRRTKMEADSKRSEQKARQKPRKK